MIRGGAPLGVAVLLAGLLGLPGCVYYNAIYNAESAFRAGESAWSLGQDSTATLRYDEVVRRAGAGYRSDPDGEWADEALYLMGRAHLRQGNLTAAEAALGQARSAATTLEVRQGAGVYLAEIHRLRGDRIGAFRLLNEAMAALPPGPELGQGHWVRAHLLLDGPEQLLGTAWWDLDRAAELGPTLRVPAALTRVRGGLRHREPARAGEGVRRLLAHQDGGARRDTLEVLLGQAAELWGVETTVGFLAGLPRSPWSGDDRARLRLGLAGVLRAQGQRAAAAAAVDGVAEGAGEVAAEARILRARWLLADAADPGVAQSVDALLLPVEEVPEAAALLASTTRFMDLLDRGTTDPLGLFAAAEHARDVLDSPELARGLFLAYANGVHGQPWVPKALMAALELSPDAAERAWIRDRLERRRLEGGRGSPYVLAARGRPAPGLDALEAELARRLQELSTP